MAAKVHSQRGLNLSTTVNAQSLSYSYLWSRTWPIILANAAVPLLGLVDTAVIGHAGSTVEMAALAICSLVFSFIYWSFGFLRMGTTAQVAQALGAADTAAIQKALLQASIVALLLAVLLWSTQILLMLSALALLSPPSETHQGFAAYFKIRIWAAPATLMLYVLMGMFIGLGRSKTVLAVQFVLNSINAVLDVVFALGLGWGIEGIAFGTVCAEYSALVFALVLAWRSYDWRSYAARLKLRELRAGYSSLLAQNSDIFIRTLFLLASFGFFTHVAGSLGTETLAANHILLQFVAFSAFFLDAYAHTLESLVGQAVGKGDGLLYAKSLKRSTVLAVITAVILALGIWVLGPSVAGMLTDKAVVVERATEYLPWVAIYVGLAVFAFQLDGLFIGAAETRTMRDCSIASSIFFILCWYGLFWRYENSGLWWSFIAYVVARGVSLGIYVPRITAKIDALGQG